MRSMSWLGPLAAALLLSAPAMADPLAGEGSRGVRILEPEAVDPPPPDPVPVPLPPRPAPPAKPIAPLRAPVIKFCERPFPVPDLKLATGETGFDRALNAKLRSGKRVVVDLFNPYPERDAAPAPLAPWLAEIKASGGSVEVKQYCNATRGTLGAWLLDLLDIKLKPASPYRNVRKYDAVLHADALDHVITQVEFAPRKAP